jgi:hypothetical protein
VRRIIFFTVDAMRQRGGCELFVDRFFVKLRRVVEQQRLKKKGNARHSFMLSTVTQTSGKKYPRGFQACCTILVFF